MQNRQVLFVKRPVGAVTPDVFELRDAAVPEPADGEVLVRNIYLSCDPYMRGQMGESGYSRGPFELGLLATRVVGDREITPRRFCGRRLCLVFSLGALFVSAGGYALACRSGARTDQPRYFGARDAGPYRLCGHVEVRQAQPGETVLSTTKGSVAGQLGWAAGARVVRGSDAKVAHMKDVRV